LLIQFDGYVVNSLSWNPAFLKYDYIGAVWPFREDFECVGNGGFSLRSKKLLAALQDQEITTEFPEDDVICIKYRELLQTKYGIKIAPKDLANCFSMEKDRSVSNPFGFHGIFNFHLYLTDFEIDTFLDIASPLYFKKLEFIELIHNLYTCGRFDIANKCAKKALLNPDYSDILLKVLNWHKTIKDTCPCNSGQLIFNCHLAKYS
jgi:hypothetical protein